MCITNRTAVSEHLLSAYFDILSALIPPPSPFSHPQLKQQNNKRYYYGDGEKERERQRWNAFRKKRKKVTENELFNRMEALQMVKMSKQTTTTKRRETNNNVIYITFPQRETPTIACKHKFHEKQQQQQQLQTTTTRTREYNIHYHVTLESVHSNCQCQQ